MKLKSNFITYEIDGNPLTVPAGGCGKNSYQTAQCRCAGGVNLRLTVKKTGFV